MKRGLAITQISILLFSIISFSFILNIDMINGADTPMTNVKKEVDTKGASPQTASPLATAVIPTSKIPHGGGGRVVQWFDGNPLPAGQVWDPKQGKIVEGTNPGWGYSTGGIIQGAMWAATIGLTVYSIAGMLGEDDDQAKAWGTAAASGIFAGKTAYSLFGPGGVWDKAE